MGEVKPSDVNIAAKLSMIKTNSENETGLAAMIRANTEDQLGPSTNPIHLKPVFSNMKKAFTGSDEAPNTCVNNGEDLNDTA